MIYCCLELKPEEKKLQETLGSSAVTSFAVMRGGNSTIHASASPGKVRSVLLLEASVYSKHSRCSTDNHCAQ